MSLAILYSRANLGVLAPPVTVEVHLSNGLPSFSIAGLPEATVRESRHRVRSAIMNSGLEFPVKRITVNLAPADLPKEGGRFDLAIALGILAASSQIPKDDLARYEIIGELALSGELLFVQGLLPAAIAATETERDLIIAAHNAEEVSLCPRGNILLASHLLDVYAYLRGEKILPRLTSQAYAYSPRYPDLIDVRGQNFGKRALEIAAAGGHSFLLSGSPGTGKTMLASRLPGILPPMTEKEALEVAAIYSVYRSETDPRFWRERPFRTPHHSTSSVAMVGGSHPPHPGEVSLAHQGVLFLDELLEFARSVLEALREPLEAHMITIARANYHVRFPANFQLIAAMNPCPCGYWGDARERCQCTSDKIKRYRAKLSGPLLDRIDLYAFLSAMPIEHLLQDYPPGESSEYVRNRVLAARDRQYTRNQKLNAQLTAEDVNQYCHLSSSEEKLLATAINHLALSARSYHRILKVARTIADLADASQIQQEHLAEAIQYRMPT